MTICEQPLRSGLCALNEGHRGKHTTRAFLCEGCGKWRAGTSHATHVVMVWGEVDDVFDFCFLCAEGLT